MGRASDEKRSNKRLPNKAYKGPATQTHRSARSHALSRACYLYDDGRATVFF